MTNNASERALRGTAVGRKAWLFFGSDDHAQAAANLFSLIASCQLHRLDPESYLAEIFRVLPYWPRDRYLELAPKYWAATRARLVESELALPVGHITVPPSLTPEQKPAAG
jgi:transposase